MNWLNNLQNAPAWANRRQQMRSPFMRQYGAGGQMQSTSWQDALNYQQPQQNPFSAMTQQGFGGMQPNPFNSMYRNTPASYGLSGRYGFGR